MALWHSSIWWQLLVENHVFLLLLPFETLHHQFNCSVALFSKQILQLIFNLLIFSRLCAFYHLNRKKSE